MSAHLSRRHNLSVTTALFAAFLLAAFSLITSTSQAAPVSQAQPQSISIPAGETVSIKVRGFCLDFGKPFPTGATSLDGLATDELRQALSYALQKGYTDNNAAQVQEALWFMRDNTWHSDDHAIGQEIVDNARSVSSIPIGSGTAITEPTAQNILTFTATFVPQTPDAFYGDGDLQIKNVGTTAIQVYLPIGAKFTVPGSNGEFQDLITYALQPAGGTPTAAATSASTSTTVPTALSTSTTAPVATAAVETPTTMPTSVPVATSMPAATPTVESAAPLPSTGGTDAVPVAIVVALASFFVVFGLLLRYRLTIK
jgi:hypothetical protein